MEIKKQIEDNLEITIGFLRPEELGGQGNFYLLGALRAEIKWADGSKEEADLLGRVKITEAKKSLKQILGLKSKVSEIVEFVDQEKINNLVTDMTLGVQKAMIAKKLWGRELEELRLCKPQSKATIKEATAS
jgi:hypothetical protein